MSAQHASVSQDVRLDAPCSFHGCWCPSAWTMWPYPSLTGALPVWNTLDHLMVRCPVLALQMSRLNTSPEPVEYEYAITQKSCNHTCCDSDALALCSMCEMEGTRDHSSDHGQGWRQPFRRSSRRY